MSLRAVVVVSFLALAGIGVGGSAASARLAPALVWSAPSPADRGAPFGEPSMADLSCPSVSLCVGVGGDEVVTSVDPTAGAMSWRQAVISAEPLNAVSCASAGLCVAVDFGGGVSISTDPTGGSSAWRRESVDVGHSFRPVACASTSLCVVFDDEGRIVTSTDPGAAKPAWSTPAVVDPNRIVSGVSCPSDLLCVAVDLAGAVLTSSAPSDPSQWSATPVIDPAGFTGVSCPSPQLCVAVDQDGKIVTSTNPTGGAAAWSTPETLGLVGPSSVSCSVDGTCVVIDSIGQLVTSTDPTGGAPAWSVPAIVDEPPPSSAGLPSRPVGAIVACPSAALCVLADAHGRVGATTDPTGPASSWMLSALPGVDNLSISCPTAALCVGLDSAGRLLTAVNPTRPHARWQLTHVYAQPGFEHETYELTCGSAALCIGLDETAGGHGETAATQITSMRPRAKSWHAAENDALSLSTSLSCVGSRLCVAVGQQGIDTSTRPTNPSRWIGAYVDSGHLNSISCPSIHLCVAVDYRGNVASSIHPARKHSWKVTHVDTTSPIVAGVGPQSSFYAISCPTRRLCVALDNGGNIFTSTHPTGPASAWKHVHVGNYFSSSTLSCASASLCVAIDELGNVVESTNPAGSKRAWTAIHIDGDNTLTSISCPTAKLCFASDTSGNILVGRARAAHR